MAGVIKYEVGKMAKKVVGVIIVLAGLLEAALMGSWQNAAADLPAWRKPLPLMLRKIIVPIPYKYWALSRWTRRKQRLFALLRRQGGARGFGEAFLLVVKQYDNGYTAGKMTAAVIPLCAC